VPLSVVVLRRSDHTFSYLPLLMLLCMITRAGATYSADGATWLFLEILSEGVLWRASRCLDPTVVPPSVRWTAQQGRNSRSSSIA
jgi:hypothetical protein